MDISLLIPRIVNNDEQAFRQFFHLYSDRLFRFANAILQVPQEAEEVVSDVFLNIWQRRESLGAVKNINTYLYSAVRNTALNYLKKRNALESAATLEFIDTSSELTVISPDKQLISKENLEAIARVINNLPPACRMIFTLVKEDGLKYQEAADILQLSINTINVQMSIALKKISQQIKIDQYIDL